MKLYLDIGNSRTKWSMFRGESCSGESCSGESSQFGVCRNGEWDILKAGIEDLEAPAEVVVSSVAGAKMEAELNAWTRKNFRLPPVFARVEKKLAGVTACYEDLSHLGVDRWLGMLAAYRECRDACIVVSAGTALTIDYIDSNGHHLGGAIAPGLEMMRKALFSGTSNVKLESLTLPQTWAPGCDTVPCVQAGVTGAIQGLLAKALNHQPVGCYSQSTDLTPTDGNARIVMVTGGDGEKIAPWCGNSVRVRENLVLEGLKLWDQSRQV